MNTLRSRDGTVIAFVRSGTGDPPIFRLPIEKLAATIPNSRVVVLPGQQHIAMDTAPDLFVREVVGFFTG